jgi:hypothetical protein
MKTKIMMMIWRYKLWWQLEEENDKYNEDKEDDNDENNYDIMIK